MKTLIWLMLLMTLLIHTYMTRSVVSIVIIHLSTNSLKTYFNLIRSYFGWAPEEPIQIRFDHIDIHAKGCVSDTLNQHWRSRFPPCKRVKRSNVTVTTDNVFSVTPSVDSGAVSAQIIVGCDSLVTDVYPCNTDKAFVNSLEDNIYGRGATDKLISDDSTAETSRRVKDILHSHH
jgi:hypothetical protein